MFDNGFIVAMSLVVLAVLICVFWPRDDRHY